MFLSREKKEQKKQLEQRLDELKAHNETLKKHVQKRSREMAGAVEAYKQSGAPKWEYLQVSDKDTALWGSLDNLGNKGWELVGLSNYTEKQTIGITVEGTIYTMYVFKRRAVDVPEELLSQFGDISGIESEIAEVGAEIERLEEELYFF